MTSTHRWLADEATRAGILIVADQPRTDHPHARGENEYTSVPILISNGPSPRTWGERHRGSRRRRCDRRTIPTHVGRTRMRRPRSSTAADHPHARGENALEPARGPRSLGPSPRTWGERDSRPTLAARRSGPSPRTWGERPCARRRPSQSADHPHARGENARAATTADPSARTIPTHVGRTPTCRRHPAVRPAADRGPSPRTWGERRCIRLPVGSRPDHPHARGENAASDRCER